MAQTAGDVVDRTEESRFVLELDGSEAELEYRRRDDRLVLTHTEVPDALEGRGIGGTLVEAAVERAMADGLTIVPLCSFARGWLERHPDAVADVSVDWDEKP